MGGWVVVGGGVVVVGLIVVGLIVEVVVDSSVWVVQLSFYQRPLRACEGLMVVDIVVVGLVSSPIQAHTHFG